MNTTSNPPGRAPGFLNAADPAGLRSRLAGIAGLNVERGLALVRGNTTNYARLLTLFADSHGRDMSVVDAEMAANHLDGVRKLAHSLKGSAGTIGAMSLSEAAGLLQAAIVEGATQEEIAVRRSRLEAEMSTLLEGIRRELGGA